MLPWMTFMVFMGFIGSFAARFPVVSPPVDVVMQLNTVANAAGQLNTVFPVTDLFLAFSSFLGIWITVVSVQIFLFIWRLIPKGII